MTYPGGKNGAGTYHKIINLIPPHSIYVEPFAGGAAIYRQKRPAEKSILIDLDPSPLSQMKYSRGLTVICDDGIQWLKDNRGNLPQDAFIYCDPPYLLTTRKSGPLYTYEMTRQQHIDLLDILKDCPCMVMLSGYWSELYHEELIIRPCTPWHQASFMAMTRGGSLAEEHLWFNYEPPVQMHDHQYAGKDFRERERIKRKVQRWIRRLTQMSSLDRSVLLAAIADVTVVSDDTAGASADYDDAGSPPQREEL